MADVQWIKLYVELRTNRKLRQIRRLPSGDTIALMWIFMICLAGEINDNGAIYFTKNFPYSDEMLADELSMDVKTVRLGLETFKRFGMIDIVDDYIYLASWERYQSTDKLAELREYNRLAQQKSRAKKKLSNNVNDNSMTDVNDNSMTSQSCQGTDKKRGEKKEEKKKEVEVVVMGADAPDNDDDNQLQSFGKIKMTENQVGDLLERMELDVFDDYCDRLSDFIDKTGATVKSPYSTILKWYNEDRAVKV